MFDITLNGKQLYHPNSTDCNITNAVIHEALNDSGYMDLTIPFTNPLWDEITERKGKVIVYKDNKEMWYGEVRDVSTDFSKNKNLYVVGEMAYLNDTVQPQKQYTNITKYDLLDTMINIHNSMVEDEKKFYVGTVGANASIRRNRTTDWEYTLDAIRKHICDDEEYVRIRHVNNVRYIDIMPLENYGKHSDQDVMFGENLLDYVEESSGEQIASICIPLGATLEEEGVPDTQNYLTCESANGGKNYVYLPGAIDRIGKITKVVHFNVLTDPQALVTAGLNWLKEKQYASLSLKLTAVDLSILHSDIDDYAVGDYIHAVCEPMNMAAWFPVRERETDLLNLANNNISVGNVGAKSITAQQAEKVEEIETLMPKKDDILSQAKKNASALLNSAGKDGHVVFRQNEQGVVYEILIMDTPSIDTATKMWRFNENGIGYAKSKNSNGEWQFSTAWTMDGHFNADAIVCDNLEVGKNVTMGANARISWSAVNGRPNAVDKDSYSDQQWLTTLSQNAITTEFLNAKNITAKDISADKLVGKSLELGTYDSITLYEDNYYYGKVSRGLWNKDNLVLYSADRAFQVLLGSSGAEGYIQLTPPNLITYMGLRIMSDYSMSSNYMMAVEAPDLALKTDYLYVYDRWGARHKSYSGQKGGDYKFVNGIAVEN